MNSLEKSRFFVAQQYIQASKNLIDGMVETGNPSVITSCTQISSDELNEALKYSSESIILPALFCLYHGIELILKGFVNIKTKKNNGHDTEELCKKFSIYYTEESELSAIFNKFIYFPKPFINQYRETNYLETIKIFYNSLRYPELKNGETYDYNSLKDYDNSEFLIQLEDLRNDIELLLRLSVKLFRQLEDAL